MKKKSLPKQTASWLLMLQKEPRTETLYIELPNSLVESLGWTEDNSLIWTPQTDGSFKVSKVEKKKK